MSLVAAHDIVNREALAGLSARKIASQIGYTVGTLYLNFRNLDDLIIQLNAQTLDELYQFLETSMHAHKLIESHIPALSKAYIQYATEHKNCWSAIFEHRLPEGESLPDWYMEKVLNNFVLVENALRSYARHLNPKQIHQSSRALWCGVHGICVLALGGKIQMTGIDSIHHLTDHLIKTFLAGLKAT
jgi:AcrR family transcriptional regulator